MRAAFGAEQLHPEAFMRTRHIIAVIATLTEIIAGVDVARTSLAAPKARAASHATPPVSPLLFGGD
jgi:hypothetical protein